ncbi:hypothetical protein STEG23_026942 [Scotinomys teguina]
MPTAAARCPPTARCRCPLPTASGPLPTTTATCCYASPSQWTLLPLELDDLYVGRCCAPLPRDACLQQRVMSHDTRDVRCRCRVMTA